MKTPLTLKWRQGKDIPFKMGSTVQSVVLGNKVYIGGGGACSNHDACTVMVYDIQRDTYSTLPQYNAGYLLNAIVDKISWRLSVVRPAVRVQYISFRYRKLIFVCIPLSI